MLGPPAQLLQAENHLARLFLFNLTSKDTTHKQIWQAHTKACLSTFSSLVYLQNTFKAQILHPTFSSLVYLQNTFKARILHPTANVEGLSSCYLFHQNFQKLLFFF